MFHSLTCPNGHTWQSAAAEAACPVCGSAGDSRAAADSSTWDSGISDELPPAPGARPRIFIPDSPDVMPVVPGYEIASELGRGGMGVVYAARHLALNRRVALKVIRGGAFAGKDELSRFRAEAEAVARLQHPNIVQIYEVGEHSGMPYLALELVEGGSLAALIRGAPLPPEGAAELVATLARAVQHAHSRGVVHRDLKPANILLEVVGSRGREVVKKQGHDLTTSTPHHLAPKVADFGLAKLDDPGRSRSGQIVGTPAYMAPEQAAGRGDLVGPPADVWALGAILYECLTSRPPFLGSSSVETVQNVLNTEPVPPARIRQDIPRDLETICLKCLRKEPESRYRTAGDLADDLDRFREGKPVLARRTPWWERATMWAKRRPAAAALVAVILLATAAFGVLAYRHFRNLDDYSRDLEAKNLTITKNNSDLEERNKTITQKSNDLVAANTATTRERDRAEDNLLGAVEAIDSLLGESGADKLAHVPHFDRTRADLLENALKACDRLLVVQAGNPRLLMLQAMTLQRAGRILTLLQRYSEAGDRLDRALVVFQELRANPGKFKIPDIAKIEALTRTSRGTLQIQMGKPERAAEEQNAALELLREYLAANPSDRDFRYLATIVNNNRGVAALDLGDKERALLHFSRARQYAEDLSREDAGNGGYAGLYALSLNALGALALEEESVQYAGELFEKAITIGRRLVKAFPEDVDFREALARSLSDYGNTLRRKGYLKRAAEPLAEGLAIREALVREHRKVGMYAVELSWSYYLIGLLHQSRDEYRTAIEWFTKGVDRLTDDRELLATNGHARTLAASVYRLRGAMRARVNLPREAASDLEVALKFVTAELRPILQADIGLLLASAGDFPKAVAAAEAAVATPNVEPTIRFNAACVFAQAAESAKEEKLARRAVAELVAAEKEGFFRDPKHRAVLDTNAAFKSLRARDDFKELVARVGKQ